MSKDKAIKKTKTPVTKSNARKTPSKNSKKDLNANKTKTPVKSKTKTNPTPQKSSQRVTRSQDLTASKKVEKTKQMINDKEEEKELIEESPKANNMMLIQSHTEEEENENQLVETSNKNELVEEEEEDLNKTIIPPEPIENDEEESEESQSIWSTIKSKLSNVLTNLFSYIIPSKENDNNDNNNKFDPNITVIVPEELEELEKEEEGRNKEVEQSEEDIPLPKLPESIKNSNNSNNNNDSDMHILLNISNDCDEDSNGVILYQHIPENEKQETTTQQSPQETTQETAEDETPESTQEETQEETQQPHEKESEKEIKNVKLFNFQTTSTPSFYSNIEQPQNLRKRKRFQLNINKNKPNKPIQSENRYFKLKYIPYTTLLAVPSAKRIRTISIEKDEEICKSPKIIKPNIIESKQINDLSFSSKTSSSLQSRLNFDLTKDSKKILSTLDILTTPSKLYSQFNKEKEKENDLNNNNNNTKIDFSFVNKDIEKRVSIVSEEVVKAVDYAKKRNSIPKFDSLNNSMNNNNTIESISPSATHDDIEYSFSFPIPSRIIVGVGDDDDDISREFQFSELNNENDEDNEEYSFSQPIRVQTFPADKINFIFSPAK